MKELVTKFARVLCALLLGVGLLITGCVDETMSVPVTGVTLDTERMELVEGETRQLSATVSPSNATNKNLLWVSSNSSIVTVSDGVVNAIKAGNASVTVKTDDGGKIATCAVVVKSKDEGGSEGGGNDTGLLTCTLSEITYNTVTFTGSINVPAADLPFISSVVIYYSEKGKFNIVDAKKVSTSKFDDGQKFTITLNNLSPNMEYDYCFAVVVRSETTYGEVKSFKTSLHPYDGQQDLSISDAVNLSSTATANCYIISSKGLYKFKTVKGNKSKSVGNVASASILFETFGADYAPEFNDLISAVCYKEGYIIFKTSDTFKEGNAVIAAKDADGVILWSWHIWFTDAPQAQRYNDVGTMMDRNLGAVSATPGDVGALGLLYQWGRKDPFLGSSSIEIDTPAKSTITWPSPVKSDSYKGTIDYATANPTVFISYNSANSDWYYTGLESTDNTRWTTSDKAKSIYDPCPAGWRVPDGGENGIWSKAFGTSSSFRCDFDVVNRGVNFGNGWDVWYPASGFRDIYGSLGNDGSCGLYWSASTRYIFAYRLYFDNYYDRYCNVYPSDNDCRAFGLSVRCLQE